LRRRRRWKKLKRWSESPRSRKSRKTFSIVFEPLRSLSMMMKYLCCRSDEKIIRRSTSETYVGRACSRAEEKMMWLEGDNATIPCSLSSKNQTKKFPSPPRRRNLFAIMLRSSRFSRLHTFLIRAQTRRIQKFPPRVFKNFTLCSQDGAGEKSYKA
jgi:hypothetical protein